MWTVLGRPGTSSADLRQVSFGHATFLGAGLHDHDFVPQAGIAPWFGIIAGGAVAALIALRSASSVSGCAAPTSRFPPCGGEIVRLVALNWESLTAVGGPVITTCASELTGTHQLGKQDAFTT